jgi:hypothetical protein
LCSGERDLVKLHGLLDLDGRKAQVLGEPAGGRANLGE